MDTVFRPTWTVGVIRVITQDQEQADAHGLLIERAFPQVRVVSRCIPDQPEGVHDAATKRTAEPKVIALACQLVEQDADGIIVSCADDPGVAEARAIVGVPVVGAGESMATAAALHEGPVGVIGITPDAPPAFPRILGERLLANLVRSEHARRSTRRYHDGSTPARRRRSGHRARLHGVFDYRLGAAARTSRRHPRPRPGDLRSAGAVGAASVRIARA